MSGPGGLAYERYRTGSSEEWMMRIGAADAPAIIFLPPLFEEMNRTRAFMAALMRLLDQQGFGCWLPDLSGTGESLLPLEKCNWDDWRSAARDAVAHVASSSGKEPLVASIRGGALLDEAVSARCYWRFAPAEGASLARDLVRASMLTPEELKAAHVELAGYRLCETMLGELRDAQLGCPEPLRTVRLSSDRAEADIKVEGPALWRRSEPATAPELAALLASDLSQWSASCAVS